MKRILAGILAAVAIAVAGFFGFGWYAQHRATAEVDAAFDQIRAGGGKASHGKVAFDWRARTLAIADITTETASDPPVRVKIGSLTAADVSQPDAASVAAASIELKDLELGAQLPAPSAAQITYKVPELLLKDYSGPTHLQRPPAGTSILDVYRAVLEQFVALSASSASIPRVDATIVSGPGTTDVSYTGLTIEGIKNGRIARQKIEKVTFTASLPQPDGKTDTTPGKMSGHIADIAQIDFDANVALAALDPDKANDDHIYPVSGRVSTGAYEIATDQGIRMRIEGISAEAMSLRPAKLQLPALLTALPPAGAQPTPEQARELLTKVAGIYDGLQIDRVELRGLSAETPEGPVKLATVSLDLRDGKADIAAEGLDARSPQGPVKLGRFALKAFDVAGMMRLSAQFADKSVQQQRGAALAMLKLVEGIELKGLEAPFKSSKKQVRIDNVALNWGQFIGPFPTQAHLTAKLAGPIDPSNPALLPLLAAGIDQLALDADLGAAWTETSSSFALSPVKLDLANLLGASANLSLAHVPRGLFTPDPQAAAAMAAQIEANGLELSLRDLGAIDLLVAQYARTHTMTREDARQALVASFKDSSQQFAVDNPDVAAAVEAISRFIETPRQTLTLKLTPRAKVPALQLVQLLKTDPSMALTQFKIEASTGL
ncbi:hypothetical protein [Bradyrhizobium sp. SZCCHNS3004]|uniref:hypothetical protein n=1 Tax=Bradyrhizobium sp. SZCCHNS3004 TaxID=3057312 RepID=UPI002916678C|nr:hypothetical protein [Bradyrhizobium sp. SZCCHNS3004]